MPGGAREALKCCGSDSAKKPVRCRRASCQQASSVTASRRGILYDAAGPVRRNLGIQRVDQSRAAQQRDVGASKTVAAVVVRNAPKNSKPGILIRIRLFCNNLHARQAAERIAN